MLYLSTIAPSTLVLLKKLMKIEEFNSLRLVGGTSLALQIRHRISIDLDFFGEIDLSPFLALKSLTYFEDAENDFSVEMIEEVSWDEVKSTIFKEVTNYLN